MCGYSLNKNKTEMNILKRKGMETVFVDHCTHIHSYCMIRFTHYILAFSHEHGTSAWKICASYRDSDSMAKSFKSFAVSPVGFTLFLNGLPHTGMCVRRAPGKFI